jgi:hypothetical protein
MAMLPRGLTMSLFLMVACRRLPTLLMEMVDMWLMSPMKERISTQRSSHMPQHPHTSLLSRSSADEQRDVDQRKGQIFQTRVNIDSVDLIYIYFNLFIL